MSIVLRKQRDSKRTARNLHCHVPSRPGRPHQARSITHTDSSRRLAALAVNDWQDGAALVGGPGMALVGGPGEIDVETTCADEPSLPCAVLATVAFPCATVCVLATVATVATVATLATPGPNAPILHFNRVTHEAWQTLHPRPLAAAPAPAVLALVHDWVARGCHGA